MAYGVVCFATLFSFVGTVLGGIRADLIATQLALMAVAAMPLERWRSFQIAPTASRPKTAGELEPVS
jgi:hypothetical protein